MNKKIGFIGCGNMGHAILKGIIDSGLCNVSDVFVSARTKETLEKIRNELAVNVCSNIEVAQKSDILFIAVKPNIFKSIIDEIKSFVSNDTVIVSIAAGVTIDNIEQWFGREIKATRTMPNTPALVGESMTAICFNEYMQDEGKKDIFDIFNSFGKCEELEEKYFHAFIAVSGSSPAYIFMLIEAMADSAVQMGIPRSKAYKFAAQAVMGSAKMILETGMHPGALKDMVCSPGGTTIDAVIELENSGFRSSVEKAMKCCEEKSKKL
ncbi:MAG: pyrroline-5-carboxylate reductase [Inconstantimicrobium porci]|uniref:Pyrroline-5-carboxylate reductase n=1 Tax=Inconstantimicrobium porci TaxID=2652291 RepID=A0A7X2T1I3_9CLOT|nr:pyrroline-5-carboxylate reductase [Inconstantimicrobium porci]MDY5912659.1 pyrroline-5-carboxylate reductase [Inconstantimicrobium porci]MSR91652.1 pyrroline-5-carboxylate reductase [Inconstantimicrobium porci]